MTKRSALSGAMSSAIASAARTVPECTTRITSPAGSAASPVATRADLIGKAFAAGRAVARGLSPELVIGTAELARDVGVPPARPCAEILFAERGVMERIEAECECGLHRSARGTAIGGTMPGQLGAQRVEALRVGEVGRRIGRVDDAARPIHRRMPDQPEARFGRHDAGDARLASSSRIAISATCSAAPSTSPVCPPICRIASAPMAQAHSRDEQCRERGLPRQDDDGDEQRRPAAIAAVAWVGVPAVAPARRPAPAAA